MILDYAYDPVTRETVALDDAVKGKHYSCFVCNEAVYKKASESERVAMHWCHVAETSENSCPGLTNHGKLIKYLAEHLKKHNEIEVSAVHRKFSGVNCSGRFSAKFVFPEYDAVVTEYRDRDVIWDVALLASGLVVAGVEAYYSHRTHDDRSRLLVPWLEVALPSFVPEGEPLLRLVSHQRLHGSRKRCVCEQVAARSGLRVRLVESRHAAATSDAERAARAWERLRADFPEKYN